MDKTESIRQYTIAEEIANSITHGFGILFSIAGLAVLSAFSSVFGNVYHIVSCSIYGATLILLYTASTLYHTIRDPRAKQIFRIIDHSAIFLLIAGTYTPFTLVTLQGTWGWSLFGTVWGIAIIGIIIQCTRLRKYRFLSIALYLIMGWSIVVAIKPLYSSLPSGGLWLVLSGGLAYTFGVLFYLWKSMRFSHAIWHIFVLAGSILHFFAVLFYVIPLKV
ncbi:MAG: hemolysin III family protein [Thermodesulfovibrionales bacterium]|nr:hemolysin III family protein [Thermodesulfovibrionales bacterium]